jgi:hypothetical protein
VRRLTDGHIGNEFTRLSSGWSSPTEVVLRYV